MTLPPFTPDGRRVAQVREMEEDAAHAPRGDVGILFTDIESSSRLWRAEPAHMKEAGGLRVLCAVTPA